MTDKKLQEILRLHVHEINQYLDFLIQRGEDYSTLGKLYQKYGGLPVLFDQIKKGKVRLPHRNPVEIKSSIRMKTVSESSVIPENPPTDPKNPPPVYKADIVPMSTASSPYPVPEKPPKDPINPPPNYVSTEDLKPLREITGSLEDSLTS